MCETEGDVEAEKFNSYINYQSSLGTRRKKQQKLVKNI